VAETKISHVSVDMSVGAGREQPTDSVKRRKMRESVDHSHNPKTRAGTNVEDLSDPVLIQRREEELVPQCEDAGIMSAT